MRIRAMTVALALAAAPAFAEPPPLPVIAVMGDRAMTGTATAPAVNGRSVFIIQTSQKPLSDWIGCEGAFAAMGPGRGDVSAECSNGEKLIGDFSVLGDTSGYAAFGTRPGRLPFSFAFGLPLKDALKYLRLPGGKTLVQGPDGAISLADK